MTTETPCLFKYFRDGVEYWTGSEELAGKRSDTGEYWVVHILKH
jgi:hypothetical protein